MLSDELMDVFHKASKARAIKLYGQGYTNDQFKECVRQIVTETRDGKRPKELVGEVEKLTGVKQK